MSVEIRVDMLGAKDLQRMLVGWKPAAMRRIVRPGVDKSSRVVSRAAKARVSVETGLLKRSIGVRVRTYPSGNVVGVVGPRKGFKRPIIRTRATGKGQAKGTAGIRLVYRDPTKYAHLVEGGTRAHALGKGSRLVRKSAVVTAATRGKYRRGAVYATSAGEQQGRRHPGATPKPFLEPAFRASLPAMRQTMREEIKKGVLKEARRMLRRKGLAA